MRKLTQILKFKRLYSSESFTNSFRILAEESLVSWLDDSSKQPKIDYLIVDVREPADYTTAHIKTAINIPSTVMLGNNAPSFFGSLLAQQLLHPINNEFRIPKNLVFHCQLSLIRGPNSAARLIQLLDEEKRRRQRTAPDSVKELEPTDIYVLDGGFKGWSKAFAGIRPELIEGIGKK
ncbi:hypothetical protein SmJEL517_g02202 [Synchytrium microbalum]|uniref:Rhodanese domain-containing protein n=1 Tax=Synchytrium microbalum TaxID=1806994 RepID=A0A507CBM7_9FUNG|nr:uncharacterized protein SmJEL517_g02202 [Synchytrium microbalum]TPX35354.1 hypothetical protein SmJEL517_g02202 [Synchytrium microbalum]